ncbi:MAG: S41 family peptidase [Candidatus Symbiothrix sp.]|jgi:carboxyl-terminal processing protease|nr:S41 family peptidase [Candidatus Symbiothrix sp.]
MTFKKSTVWVIVAIVCALIIGVILGGLLSNNSLGRSFFMHNKMGVILDIINDDYVDSVDIRDITENAIYSIVDELDPHSAYISAEEFKLVSEELEGQFGGIGITYFVYRDTIVIASVVHGGPSSKAGIVPGDRLVSINDKELTEEDRTEESTLQTLRGAVGSTVQLGILHRGAEQPVVYTIKRDTIPQTTIRAAFQIAEGIGYIKIWDKFTHSTYDEFMQAAAELQADGCSSFIVDLRTNGGGAYEAAHKIVNEFLPANQLIVTAKGRAFQTLTSISDGTGKFAKNQLVVLVDQLSASASEIVAGAIQDNDRGLIIGRRTYGKGLVQRQIELSDGSAVRLTVARYYTPSGRNIQRPYEMGNAEAYNQEWLDQFENWESFYADSVKFDQSEAYKTVHNRTVYGSGGIMPDVFVPLDTAHRTTYYIALEENDVFNHFANEYVEQNRDFLTQFKNYTDLLDYLKAQQLLYKVVMYAEESGIRRRSLQISRCYKQILQSTYACILRNVFGEQAFYPVYLYGDPVIAKGIQAIQKELANPKAVVAMKYRVLQ